jgi:hypothetical protein
MCVALSLTRGRVCRLQSLLVLASAVSFGSESRGTLTIFYCLRFETALFVASFDTQGYGGGINPAFTWEFSSSGKLLSFYVYNFRRTVYRTLNSTVRASVVTGKPLLISVAAETNFYLAVA